MISDKIGSKDVYYRLISLWVVCEAFAGGIMHASRLPFTGMIVSSLSVTCIILIAYNIPSPVAILKATIIVAFFKLLLSPHSPPTAYIAVFFQGYLGYLLFSSKKFFTISAIALAVLALTESAIQRILVLLILYGNEFWYAVDQFIMKIAGGYERRYSFLLAGGYILLHAITGIFVGLFAARLSQKAAAWRSSNDSYLIKKTAHNDEIPARPKKKRIKWLFIMLWAMLALLFLQSYFYPGSSILPTSKVWWIILRSCLIVLSWYMIIAPLSMLLLKRVLQSEKIKSKIPQEINQLIPQTRYILTQSWLLSRSAKGIGRLSLFVKILVMNILNDKS